MSTSPTGVTHDLGPAATVAIDALVGLGIPKELVRIPVAGVMYLEHMGAPEPTLWWPPEAGEDQVNRWLARQHSELSLVVVSTLSLMRLFGRPARSDEEIEFDVAFLFFSKGLAPSAAAIHLLTHARCYADALAVVRALHTRVNLLALIALAPHLFDEWLKAPKESRFLDGHVRDELSNHGIYTFPHMYEQASEVVHGQLTALAEVGYMESGLFPHIPAIENRVLASAKFLFAIIGHIGMSVLSARETGASDDEVRDHQTLFSLLARDILAPNRIDHLPTSIAEDRHWVQAGKDNMTIGQWFSPEVFGRQLGLFSRFSQPKRLGKPYRKR